MSRIEELLQELCPDGVEYKTLGELGKFYGGLSGKSKEDFKDGNAKLITYMNVFSNIALKLDVTDTVKISDSEKQNTIQYGDVLFTGSSETPDECGMSSVLTTKTDEKLYLNSFCFIYRFNNLDIVTPDFSKYLFSCEYLRKQIKKTASGVTRFNVSKKKMEKVKIPVPSLEVQREIVKILDNFTELTVRKKQYEYYRDMLLDFDVHGGTGECEWRTIGEVCYCQSGGTPSTKIPEYWNGNIKWLASTVCNNTKTVNEVTKFITEAGAKKSRIMKPRTTLIALVGATIGKTAFLPYEAAINQNIAGIYPINEDELMPDFVYYYCFTYYEKFMELSNGKLAMANMTFVRNLQFPIIPKLPNISPNPARLTAIRAKRSLKRSLSAVLVSLAMNILPYTKKMT